MYEVHSTSMFIPLCTGTRYYALYVPYRCYCSGAGIYSLVEVYLVLALVHTCSNNMYEVHSICTCTAALFVECVSDQSVRACTRVHVHSTSYQVHSTMYLYYVQATLRAGACACMGTWRVKIRQRLVRVLVRASAQRVSECEAQVLWVNTSSDTLLPSFLPSPLTVCLSACLPACLPDRPTD